MTNGDELIVVRRKEYEQLQRQLYEVRDAMAKIRRGEKEFRGGKTRITVKSLTEIK